MKTAELVRRLYSLFPKETAESYDHVGMMIGPRKENVDRIALALDLDRESLRAAISGGADMVITHHPVFFGSRREILLNNPERLEVYETARHNGIMAYSFHTNFDGKFPEGMNEALARKLGLLDIHPLVGEPMMIGGRLAEKMAVGEFASFAKKALGAAYGLLLPYGGKEVETVAIIGGGGASYWRSAYLEGYDIYISGDVSHHVRRDIALQGFNYLDLPHEIENIFVERMTEILLNINQGLTIIPILHELQPLVV